MFTERRTAASRAAGWLATALVLAILGLPAGARAQITVFKFEVTPSDVVYTATANASGFLDIYFNPAEAPGKGSVGDQRQPAGILGQSQFVWQNVPNGIYHSYLQHRVDPNDANDAGQVVGPLEVVVGPDLVFCPLSSSKVAVSWSLVSNSVRWKARVCNVGGRPAGPFRVGFWWDRPTSPPPGAREDQFVSIDGLDPIWSINTWPPCYNDGGLWGSLAPYFLCVDRGQNPQCCPEVTIESGPLANGTYTSWAKVDSADFQAESNEDNNIAGPYSINLSLADLEVSGFSATVSGGSVNYRVKVCNKGTAAAADFYVDVYPDRKLPPQPGYPGELIQGVALLGPGDCTDLQFTKAGAPDGVLNSWVLADADDFVKEPDEMNNRKGPMEVTVSGGEGCIDADGDGFGVGQGCEGPTDCDDSNKEVHPQAVEVCGDGLDNNCNLTVDDGCPGVNCSDADGDGWPDGADCVVKDCDDNDPDVFPHNPEICGDGKDNNCNGIVDDGCPGRACVDADEDGYGVGAGCPGPQDGDDNDPDTHPGAPEICGDGIDNNCNGVIDDGCAGCVDNDGDGYGVGDGCGPLLQRDCDDSDPTTYPHAAEICDDGKDNNCNFTVDDGCPGVDSVDEDGDGWPSGPDTNPDWVDPDDHDPTTYPGATEICGDGIDNNANGTVDDGCPGIDCIDLDGDNWPTGPDCNPDYVDCDDGDISIHPKRPGGEICNDGIDNTCSGTIDLGCRTCEDRDGDGFFAGPDCPLTTPQDCNDDVSNIYPGAPVRAAGGVDVNCDGVVSAEEARKEKGCDCGGGGEAPDAGADRFALMGLLLVGGWRRRGRRPNRRI
jgi:hypothetical protein